MKRIFGCPSSVFVIPGRCEASNPESRDSGFSPTGCPGMTGGSLSGLRAKALLLLAQFRRQRLAEILGIEHLPDLDLGAAVERRALHPFDRFVARLHLDQPEAGNQVAGHRERAAFDRALL